MNTEQELLPCMWAEVVADDVTGELLWECREADGRGHVSTEAVVELSAKTFAVGTMLEIREPGFFPEPPSCRSSDEQAEVVGYVDRFSEPTRISPTEQPGLEMPVFASPPAVAAGGVTEERLEAGAKALCLATGLDWDSIDEAAEGDDKDAGPETRRYFRQWFKPALLAALAVRDTGGQRPWLR